MATGIPASPTAVSDKAYPAARRLLDQLHVLVRHTSAFFYIRSLTGAHLLAASHEQRISGIRGKHQPVVCCIVAYHHTSTYAQCAIFQQIALAYGSSTWSAQGAESVISCERHAANIWRGSMPTAQTSRHGQDWLRIIKMDTQIREPATDFLGAVSQGSYRSAGWTPKHTFSVVICHSCWSLLPKLCVLVC